MSYPEQLMYTRENNTTDRAFDLNLLGQWDEGLGIHSMQTGLFYRRLDRRTRITAGRGGPKGKAKYVARECIQAVVLSYGVDIVLVACKKHSLSQSLYVSL